MTPPPCQTVASRGPAPIVSALLATALFMAAGCTREPPSSHGDILGDSLNGVSAFVGLLRDRGHGVSAASSAGSARGRSWPGSAARSKSRVGADRWREDGILRTGQPLVKGSGGESSTPEESSATEKRSRMCVGMSVYSKIGDGVEAGPRM